MPNSIRDFSAFRTAELWAAVHLALQAERTTQQLHDVIPRSTLADHARELVQDIRFEVDHLIAELQSRTTATTSAVEALADATEYPEGFCRLDVTA